jgi:hypothetical protein
MAKGRKTTRTVSSTSSQAESAAGQGVDPHSEKARKRQEARPQPQEDLAHQDKIDHTSSRQEQREGNGHVDLVYKLNVIENGGSYWPVVTEIRVKYQVLRFDTNPNEIPTYEIYLDPSAFDAIIARQGICDSARQFAAEATGRSGGPAPHARLLKLDGRSRNWDELLAQYGNHITRPRLATPGLFCSEHTSLCIHERNCNMNCLHDGDEELMN